ncbi:hypothetical protein [Natrinema amylolyticum]|uniref:hypothetical protein n=1 Tax=Natrinema amylolyticum TaxID=2878679 RepID=UPI001CFC0694|nr:hypothetical protein [Natrinema amylolyticum]
MERDGRATAKWLLEPAANGAPLSVGILGWIVLINGIRIGIRGSSGETAFGIWPSIVLGGGTVALGWTIITGRPIGLAGGFLAWSVHITSGFFGVLNAGTVEGDVDLLLGIVAAATLWLTGLWILYRNRDFFLEHVATDSEPIE